MSEMVDKIKRAMASEVFAMKTLERTAVHFTAQGLDHAIAFLQGLKNAGHTQVLRAPGKPRGATAGTGTDPSAQG